MPTADEPPFDGLSRRGFFTASALAALGLTAAELASVGIPAEAAVVWGHPFTFYSGRSRGFTGQWPAGHAGIDYTPGVGTPIYAVADGVVTASQWHDNYGEAVWITHGDGYVSIYAHMLYGTRIQRGVSVTRGTYIGRVGNTGKSYGAHLHIEIQRNNTALNPDPFIGPPAPLAGTTPPPPPPPPPKTLGEDEMLFLKADSNGSEGLAKAGEIYRRVEGSWIGVASLEAAVLVYALADRGALVAGFGGNDVELMFATDGLWEQSILTGSVSSSRGPLTGRGYRTGRRIYPGAPGRLGQWHYPHEIGTATP